MAKKIFQSKWNFWSLVGVAMLIAILKFTPALHIWVQMWRILFSEGLVASLKYEVQREVLLPLAGLSAACMVIYMPQVFRVQEWIRKEMEEGV
jgi:hypothetical protein